MLFARLVLQAVAVAQKGLLSPAPFHAILTSMNRKVKAADDFAREELSPLLTQLRRGHDVLPFM